MSDIDEKLDAGERAYRQKHPVETQDVKIKVDVSDVKRELKDIVTTEQQLEEMTALKEDYECKLKLIAEQKIEEKIRELGIPEDEQAYFRSHPDAFYAYGLAKTGKNEKSGKGTLPASLNYSGNSESGKKEFSSYEEMIDYLRAIGDTETLNKLWLKSVQGMKENPNKTMNFEYKDDFKDGKSAIRRKLDRDNERVRSGH